MDTAFYQPLGPSEILPRYAFLEVLLPGRQVLEVGSVAATRGRSAALLRARGARRVLALDRSADAVEAARREHATDPEIVFVAGTPDDLPPEETFDLVLVADAAPLVRAPSSLEAVARRVAADGWAVLGLRNPAGACLALLAEDEPREGPPTWGELRSLLEARFPSVEAATQSAFVGYRFSPMAEGEREAAVDATLVEPEECSYFLAICGQRPSGALGAEAIVALPAAPLAVAAGRRSELLERLRLAEEALATQREVAPESLQARVRELEAQVEAERARARRLERDVETLTALERSARARAEKAEEMTSRPQQPAAPSSAAPSPESPPAPPAGHDGQ